MMLEREKAVEEIFFLFPPLVLKTTRKKNPRGKSPKTNKQTTKKQE